MNCFRFLISLLFVVVLAGPGWTATYYMRSDGTAANKEAATSCTSTATAMSVTKHNAETFASGDIIALCNTGAIDFDSSVLPIIVPTSGVTYQPYGTDAIVIDGSTLGSVDGSTCTSVARGFSIIGKTGIGINVGQGSLTIQNVGSEYCTATDNDSSGVFLNEGASVSIGPGVIITDSGDQNIQLKGDTIATEAILNGVIFNNAKDDGISCHNATVTVTGGSFTGNSQGIQSLAACTVSIDGSTFTNNKDFAIGFGGASTTLKNLTLNINSGQKGITYTPTSAGAVIENTVCNILSAATQPYCYYSNTANAKAKFKNVSAIADASLSKKGIGLNVTSGATVTLEGTTTLTNLEDGVYYTSATATTFTGMNLTSCGVGVIVGAAAGVPTVTRSSFNHCDNGIKTSVVNVVSMFNRYLIDASDIGIWSTGANAGVTSINDTFIGSGTKTGAAIYLANATGTDSFANGILTNLAAGVTATSGRNYTLTNFDLYNNTANSVGDGTPTLTDCLTADPLFASPTDFNVTASSPLKNKGANLCSALTEAYDMAGHHVCSGGALDEMAGSTMDIGAYEFWSGGTKKKTIGSWGF